MKNILNINQKARIISDDFFSQGAIVIIGTADFAVKLEQDVEKSSICNKKVEIFLATPQCLIKFGTIITKKKDNVLYIEYPTEYKKIQRREYSRADLKLPIKCCGIDNNHNCVFDSQTFNISGGGMQIPSPINLEKDSLLEVKIQLRPTKIVKVLFEVSRSEKLINSDKFFVAGTFKKISNTDRITIVQLCFKRQLELRCKGLGSSNLKGDNNH